jgi:hypothetical protein
MLRLPTIVLLLLGASSLSFAIECKSGDNRAGCVGSNGAVVIGPNGVRTTNQVNTNNQGNTVSPGQSATGRRGNTVTKGLQSNCAWVNGQRVCR